MTTTGFPTWNLTITDDSQPIWFFCKQFAPTPHCDAGMVGAINPPTSGDNTFEAFQAAAEAHVGPAGVSVFSFLLCHRSRHRKVLHDYLHFYSVLVL
jgi:hypothetical protein